MTATVQIIIDDNYLQKEVVRQVNERLVDMGVGTWWDMKRLQYETSRSYDWLMEYVVTDACSSICETKIIDGYLKQKK